MLIKLNTAMRKYAFIILLSFHTYLASAQSFDFLDLPVINELWIEFKDTVGSNFVMTPPGYGQTWNYLNSFTVNDTIQYFPQMPNTAPANIANLYPSATAVMAGVNLGDYTFVKTDLTGMYIDGEYIAAGFDIVGNTFYDKNYSSDLLYIPVPFDTGYVVQNTAIYSYIFPDSTLMPDALVRATYTTFQDFEAEAQGSLTTPLGNYPLVTRIKEMITKTILYEIDSFALGNFTYLTDIPFPTTYAYKWIKDGPNCLVMTATLDEFQNVTEASYFTSAGLVSTHSTMQNNFNYLYPNPVKVGEQLTLKLEEGKYSSFTIYDISGREIFNDKLSSGTILANIKTNELNAGMYYISLKSEGSQSKTLKLSVVK